MRFKTIVNNLKDINMKKTYIAPKLSGRYSFVDDLMVSLPSGGSASENNVTEAEVKDLVNERDEWSEGLW